MSKIIKAQYIKEKDSHKIIFKMRNDVVLDLSSDNNTVILDFFHKLLNNLCEDHDIKFMLEDSKEKDIFYDAAKKYIENLNKEIEQLDWDELDNNK